MRVVLSCTTTASRQHLFQYCVQSLLSQTIRPDLFLVNLSRAPSRDDPGFESVPRFLDVAGVEIQWVEDIGPYGKLLPTLEHVGDEDLIVTADDDLLYAPTWLESLRNEALRNPTAVIAARARTMAPTPWGGWRNYRLWPPVT